jgi:hypothetical protein
MVLHLFPPFVVFDDTDDDIDLAAGAVAGTIVRRGAGVGSERGRSTDARRGSAALRSCSRRSADTG